MNCSSHAFLKKTTVVIFILYANLTVFTMLHRFKHVYLTVKTKMTAWFRKLLLTQRIRILYAWIEKLCHQISYHQSSHHKNIDCNQSYILLRRKLLLVAKIISVWKKVNTKYVNQDRSHYAYETSVPFVIEHKNRRSFLSIEYRRILLQRCKKLGICLIWFYHLMLFGFFYKTNKIAINKSMN